MCVCVCVCVCGSSFFSDGSFFVCARRDLLEYDILGDGWINLMGGSVHNVGAQYDNLLCCSDMDR